MILHVYEHVYEYFLKFISWIFSFKSIISIFVRYNFATLIKTDNIISFIRICLPKIHIAPLIGLYVKKFRALLVITIFFLSIPLANASFFEGENLLYKMGLEL